MKRKNILILTIGVVIFMVYWFVNNGNNGGSQLFPPKKNSLTTSTGGALTSENPTKEILKDIFIASRSGSSQESSYTGTFTQEDIIGTLPQGVTSEVSGSGFFISGSTVYGDKSRVLVLEDGRIVIGYEPWQAAKNWKEIQAPKGWGIELNNDTLTRRFYYYTTGMTEENLKKVAENVKLRYNVMYNLLHDTNQDDIFVKQGKECLTEIGKSFEYQNTPQDGFFKICKPPVTNEKRFSSEKDLAFGRYAFSLLYRASQEKNVKICDKFSDISFDVKTYSSQFSLGEYSLICRGIVDGGGQKILDYVYGFTVMSGLSNRCELYTDEENIRKICESITDTLR